MKTKNAETASLPLVSIIIPAFNAEYFLQECLSSLESQTYPNIEIILVDDGSQDGTAELVKREFPAVRYVWQENSGTCSSPRNTGASLASGEYIGFFDADDLMEPKCVATHVAAFMDFPMTGLSLVNYQNFAAGTGENLGVTHFKTCTELMEATCLCESQRRVAVNGQLARRILGSENFAIASGMVVTREVFESLRGFDASLCASEDFDFAYRSSMVTDMVLSWDVGFRRRIHDGNMSNQTGRILREKIKSRLRLMELETDEQARRRLRASLKDLYLSAANAKGAFSRWERLVALKNSLLVSVRPFVKHLKVVTKILIGR